MGLQVAAEPRKEIMTFNELTEALDNANIPFSIEGKQHDVIYVDGVIICFNGKVYAKPHQSTTCFNTDGSSFKPLPNVKLKDLQPMIQHYRKFHPESPEISSGKADEEDSTKTGEADNEKEFHVLIVTRRKDGSTAVYNHCHLAKNRLAIFNYFLKKFDPNEIETLTILEELEA